MTKQIIQKLVSPLRRVAARIRNSVGPEPMQPLWGTGDTYINAPGTAKEANQQIRAMWDKWAEGISFPQSAAVNTNAVVHATLDIS